MADAHPSRHTRPLHEPALPAATFQRHGAFFICQGLLLFYKRFTSFFRPSIAIPTHPATTGQLATGGGMSSSQTPTPRPDAHLRDNHSARPLPFLNPTRARLPVEQTKSAAADSTSVRPQSSGAAVGTAPPGAQIEWRSRDNRKGECHPTMMRTPAANSLQADTFW